MAKEVRIKLTAGQKSKIKAATGKVMHEIRVSSIGNSLAVTSAQSVSARLARVVDARLAKNAASRLARAVDARVARDTVTARLAREAGARMARATDND